MTPPAGQGVAAPSRRLGVVLVNWNRADFTTECLESLLRSTAAVQVAVVDNASADGSADRIAAWAAGTAPWTPPDNPLGRLSQPPLAKPVALERMTGAAARASAPRPGVVSLIDSGGNPGFAGGNNIGLAHLFADPGIDAVWLLNNDTVTAPDAAAALLARFAADARLGMCGTMVRFYHRPDTVQVLGGYRFDALTGNGSPVAGGSIVPEGAAPPMDEAAVVAATDFIIGASLAISRGFYERVGPMSERYFLYFEEIDWATRNRRLGADAFATGYASDATIWHKEGGSIGSGGGKGARSAMSDFYLQRARLRYFGAFAPWLLPFHYGLGLALIGRRLLRRQPDKARAIWAALRGRELP